MEIPQHNPGSRLSVQAKAWFYENVQKGTNPHRLGERLGISRATVRRLMKQMTEAYGGSSPLSTAKRIAQNSTADGGYPEPRLNSESLVHPQATQAWHEFGYWRTLLLGRRHILWQIEMVQILMAWWEAGQATVGTEAAEVIKGIVNTPPGGGKSTTITHDFPGWLITRNRDIRIALGARTSGQSIKYTRRLRATLEKNVLLNMYYGRFKPLEPEEWRQDAFIVDGVTGHSATMAYKLALAGFDPTHPEVKARLEDPQDDIHVIIDQIQDAFLTGEKESTVAALSQEMWFLGGRIDINLWDDLCDKKNSSNAEQRETLAEWWFAEAESRCEPGGLVGLIGTRFGKFDLYNLCKNMVYQAEDDVTEKVLDEVISDFTDEEMQQVREDIEKEMVDKYGANYSELATPGPGGMRKARKIYRYYKFPAHDLKVCEHPGSLHHADHVACVLDPKRVSYTHLRKVEAQDPRKFALTYQQDDEATLQNLVQDVWLTGGTGEDDGIIYPGCYNYQRRMVQLPEDLEKKDCVSIAMVDPSAQNFWAIFWLIYDVENDIDYVMDIERGRISAGTFMDYDIRKRRYSGIANDWQIRSRGMGWPIGLWIIEENAAQRYLFQHNWVTQWMRDNKVNIKGHKTGRNKADEELGVETIAGRFMRGQVDLPFHEDDIRTQVKIREFAKELTGWPDAMTDDQVMSYWFHHANRELYPMALRVSQAGSAPKHIYADSMPGYITGEEPELTGHRIVQEDRRSRR